MNQRNSLLAVSFVLAAGLAFGAWWFVQTPVQTTPVVVEGPFEPLVPAVQQEANPEPARTELPVMTQPEEAPPETTVVFPLEIELELVRSELAVKGDGISALGSAATAHFKGSVHTVGDAGVRAEIAFIAGPNESRMLYCDRNGNFGANDFYPGLSIVKVSADGIPGSMREVLLRQDRDTLLNLGYGRPAVVWGEVIDKDGKGLVGAKVTMDGQVTTTDEQGGFVFTQMAPGEVLTIVEKPGYAMYREQVTIAVAKTVEKGRLKFVLEPGARLQVTIEDRINVDSKAQLFVLPQTAAMQRKFPWYKIDPIELYPGGTVTIEDLPAETVSLRLFHSGAIAKPAERMVALRAGETMHETLHLEAAPVINGVVVDEGHPVAGARVRLEAPDRVRAMLSAFGESNFLFLESDVFPNMPSAVQETLTNELGEYVLSASENVSRDRYLVAMSRDGKRTASAVLRGGETRVDLELRPQAGGDGVLTVQTNDRYQPLPVKITVNGTPRDLVMLASGKDLHIDGLTPGSWLVSARWSTELLQKKLPIELRKDVSIALTLPIGAIDGQDLDTRKRAGKLR